MRRAALSDLACEPNEPAVNAVLRWVGRWGRATRWLESANENGGRGTRADRSPRIADIGCAFGFGSARLASTGAWVVGVEPDWGYVERGARTYPNVAFVQATANRLPFGDGVFNSVTMLDVLEHVGVMGKGSVEAQSLAVGEVARALTVGGRAMITVPASGPAAWFDSLNRYAALAQRANGWLPVDPTEIAPGASHLHFSEGALVSLLGPAGLKVVHTARFGTGVLPELVHLAILLLTRGLVRSETAYRRWRFVYFGLHVLDDFIPVPKIGYSLSVVARRVR
jgi:SAM-dependent methyltransferase